MSANNAYKQYKEQSIYTMTKGEILILLYDEIITRLTKARILGYNKDYSAFENEVKGAGNIIHYLEQTLDRQYEVSSNLFRLYDFIHYELSRAVASRNIEIIDEVIPFVTELRDTWKEADRLSRIQ